MQETSAGCIIFIKDPELQYLLLHHHYKSEYWNFPKGKLELDETPQQAALRETKEETGLDVTILPYFKEKIFYFYREHNKTISKTVHYFVAQAKSKNVVISKEHVGFIWVSPTKALKKLSFPNSQEVFKKANSFITTYV
jgi:bis(5'-nucleosidyl)-tetraphosphatase